jgi:hypothetical protein
MGSVAVMAASRTGKKRREILRCAQDDESKNAHRRQGKQVKGARLKAAATTSTAKRGRDAGAMRDGVETLLGFLHGFEVGFEGGAVLFLGFQLRLEFFYQELEAADFVAQFLSVG